MRDGCGVGAEVGFVLCCFVLCCLMFDERSSGVVTDFMTILFR